MRPETLLSSGETRRVRRTRQTRDRTSVRIGRTAILRAAVGPYMLEMMEQRVMLSAGPRTELSNLNTPINSPLVDLLSDKLDEFLNGQLTNFATTLPNAVGKLPIVGKGLKTKLQGSMNALLKDDLGAKLKTEIHNTVTGSLLQSALWSAIDAIPDEVRNIKFCYGSIDDPHEITQQSDVPLKLYESNGISADGADEVEIPLIVTANLLTSDGADVAVDLGVNLAGLSFTGGIKTYVDASFAFTLGANLNGYYIDLGALPGGAPVPDVKLITSIGATANLGGQLGFMSFSATTNPARSTALTAEIGADLAVNTPLNRITSGTTMPTSVGVELSAGAMAEVHLNLGLKAEKIDSNNKDFTSFLPSLKADFDLKWDLGGVDVSDGGFTVNHRGELKELAFNNVTMVSGSFFDFLAPIVSKVNEVIDPFRPVIDFLTARLPVLSDIESMRDYFQIDPLTKDNNVTLLEVAAKLTEFKPEAQSLIRAANTVIGVIKLVSDVLQVIRAGKDGTLDLYVGTINLMKAGDPINDGVTLSNLTSGKNPDVFVKSVTDMLNQFNLAPTGSKEKNFADFSFKTPTDGFMDHVKFPLLQDPALALQLLTGRSDFKEGNHPEPAVSLVEIVNLDFSFTVDFDQFFRIYGPLGVALHGSITPYLHLGFGYDTSGIFDYFATPQADRNLTQLFDGFYVIDGPGAEFGVNAGVDVYAALDVVVASAGVGGGIHADFGLDFQDVEVTTNPNDPSKEIKTILADVDGRLHPSELSYLWDQKALLAPIGKVTAGLSAFLKIGWGWFSYTKRFDIAQVTLLEFGGPTAGNPPPPVIKPTPILAEKVDGVLYLNMGPRAEYRNEYNIADGDETFAIRPAADGGVEVYAFGFTSESFKGIDKIVAQGGEGSDTIVVEPLLEKDANGAVISTTNLTQKMEFYGDFQDPTKVLSTNVAHNDHLMSGAGPATLRGGAGEDALVLGPGGGCAWGEAGSDTLTGGSTSDTMSGGDGNDVLEGRGGSDQIHGNAGDDVVIGGYDSIFSQKEGQAAVDEYAGLKLANPDTGDQLYGDEGADLIGGGEGNDTIVGGDGPDTMHGDLGSDKIYANSIDATALDSDVDVMFGDEILFTDFKFKDIQGSVVLPGTSGASITTEDKDGDSDSFATFRDDSYKNESKRDEPLEANGVLQILLSASDGDDEFHCTLSDTVRGQGGNDLLILQGTGSFDLKAEAGKDADHKGIAGINRIDLNLTGQDHLLLDASSVRSLSDGDSVLLVSGGPGDGVELNDPWMVMPTETIIPAGFGQTYRVFQTIGETIKIGPGVDVSLQHMLSKTVGVTGQPILFTSPFKGADPDTAQIIWNFGDGATLAPVSVLQPGALTPTHPYDYTNKELGTAAYKVSLMIMEQDGGNTTITDEHLVISDMLFTPEGLLYIGGTPGNDSINVSNRAGSMINVFRWGGTLVGVFPANPNRPVFVYGGSGNDTLDVAEDFLVPVEAHGGAGNDLVRGGACNDSLFGEAGNDGLDSRAGNDAVVGGDGNDTIYAGRGDDLVIGGRGSDWIYGESGDDIMIAAYTKYDSDPFALGQIIAKWTAGGDYATRAARVRAGGASPFLKGQADENGAKTVFDGSMADNDFVTGGTYGVKDHDWYFAPLNLHTKLADRYYDETVDILR